MIGLDPIPRWGASYPLRMVNLLIGVPLESFLAIALLSSRQTIAPMYSLSSTHAGAGVLWVLSELLTVAAVIPIYFQWMASEDRKTAREDARLDAEASRAALEPDPWRRGTRQRLGSRVERIPAQRVLTPTPAHQSPVPTTDVLTSPDAGCPGATGIVRTVEPFLDRPVSDGAQRRVGYGPVPKRYVASRRGPLRSEHFPCSSSLSVFDSPLVVSSPLFDLSLCSDRLL